MHASAGEWGQSPRTGDDGGTRVGLLGAPQVPFPPARAIPGNFPARGRGTGKDRRAAETSGAAFDRKRRHGPSPVDGSVGQTGRPAPVKPRAFAAAVAAQRPSALNLVSQGEERGEQASRRVLESPLAVRDAELANDSAASHDAYSWQAAGGDAVDVESPHAEAPPAPLMAGTAAPWPTWRWLLPVSVALLLVWRSRSVPWAARQGLGTKLPSRFRAAVVSCTVSAVNAVASAECARRRPIERLIA